MGKGFVDDILEVRSPARLSGNLDGIVDILELFLNFGKGIVINFNSILNLGGSIINGISSLFSFIGNILTSISVFELLERIFGIFNLIRLGPLLHVSADLGSVWALLELSHFKLVFLALLLESLLSSRGELDLNQDLGVA